MYLAICKLVIAQQKKKLVCELDLQLLYVVS